MKEKWYTSFFHLSCFSVFSCSYSSFFFELMVKSHDVFCVWDGCGSRLQCRLWWRGVCACWWGRVAAVSRERWLVLHPTSERKGGIPAYSLLFSGIHAHKTHSVHKLCTKWLSVHLCVLVEHFISKPWVFLVKKSTFRKSTLIKSANWM